MSGKQAFNPGRRAFLSGSAAGVGLSVAGVPTRALSRIEVPHQVESLKATTETYGFCDMCFWRCGIKVRSRDGRAVKIDGNPEHPQNYGIVCAKGNSGLMVAYDPDRLKYPMRRVGKRGEGRWERISWEEALDEVADGLARVRERHGAHALAMMGHGTWVTPYQRLVSALGTPNLGNPTFGICCGPRLLTNDLVAGRNLSGNETLDLENCRYFLMLGRNITESLHNGETRGWMDALAEGAKSVYVDPRYTITASKSEEWLPIRPLTDHALLLALIHVVIEEQLYDRAFVEQYTIGLDELRDRVREYTPEWAESETEIPASTIRRIAREMAEAAPRVLVYSPRRVTRTTNQLGTGIAIAQLNTLFGIWDRKGGAYSPQSFDIPGPDLPPFERPKAPELPPEWRDAEGRALRLDGAGEQGRFPLAHPEKGLTNRMWEAMADGKPYPIKAFFAAGGNGFMSGADFDTIHRALENLDFFVAADVMPNEMNMYADILLPEASYLERYDDLQTGGAREGYVALRSPAMAPLHDTRDAWSICKGIAERLDLGHYFPHDTVADMVDERLRKVGLSLQELERTGVAKIPADPTKNFPREYGGRSQFPTPSGKAELIPSRLKELGYEDALAYKPQVSPEEGEFHFTFGRVGVHTHARTQNNLWLADFMDENALWLHPDAAQAVGVRNGDRVRVTDRSGRSGTLPAKVTRRIRRDTVFMAHGFGRFDPRQNTAYGKGAADSNLVSSDIDPYIGSIAMDRSLVRVEKLEGGEA
ncbi:molybdopterin-containing oxidoreductase family protein [Alkalilimnicola ehrlichii]|uniref:molybdopterin-containing oxidoreductase family protein n=1 Tax=Alkalilimnicola ehrlichii TaxID=351052 RepID=UPI003BA02A52